MKKTKGVRPWGTLPFGALPFGGVTPGGTQMFSVGSAERFALKFPYEAPKLSVVRDPENAPLIIDGRVVAEPQGVNKCRCDGIPNESLTGLVKTGDVAAIFSIVTVDDNKYYELDNSQGSSSAYVMTSGVTLDNTNIHTASAVGYAVQGDAYLTRSSVSGNTSFDSVLARKSFTYTPTNTSDVFAVWCLAGAIVRFRLPQLEESPFATSIIPAVPSTDAVRSPTTEQSKLLTSREFDLIAGAADGVELIENGDFSDGSSGWVASRGAASVEDGRCKVSVYPTFTFNDIRQFPDLNAGDHIEIRCQSENISATKMAIFLLGDGTTFDVTSGGYYVFRHVIAVDVGRVEFRVEGAEGNYGYYDNISIKKISNIRTQFKWRGQFGAGWEQHPTVTGSILSTLENNSSILLMRNTDDNYGELLSYDGTQWRWLITNWQAGVDYIIRVRAGISEDMLNADGSGPETGLTPGEKRYQIGYSDDGGATWTFSASSAFRGYFPTDGTPGVDAKLHLPYCGVAGPAIPVHCEYIGVEPL